MTQEARVCCSNDHVRLPTHHIHVLARAYINASARIQEFRQHCGGESIVARTLHSLTHCAKNVELVSGPAAIIDLHGYDAMPSLFCLHSSSADRIKACLQTHFLYIHCKHSWSTCNGSKSNRVCVCAWECCSCRIVELRVCALAQKARESSIRVQSNAVLARLSITQDAKASSAQICTMSCHLDCALESR
jgi:hypothetical protein